MTKNADWPAWNWMSLAALYFSKPRREGRRLVPPVKTTSTHQPTMNTFDLSELVSDFLSSLRTWMSAGDQKERDLLL